MSNTVDISPSNGTKEWSKASSPAGTTKRLAIFTSDMLGGGAQQSVLRLARGIAAREYIVDLVLARMDGPFLDQVPRSVTVVDLEASRVLTSMPALVRYLRSARPDAVFSALDYVNIVALWARRLARVPTRLVVSERSTMTHDAQHSSDLRGKLVPQLARRFYPWADGIVAVSQGVADDLAQVTGLARQSIQVIYNPIATPELRKKAQAPLDHVWFKTGEPPVVLAAGRLAAQKDFHTLIQGFAQVRKALRSRLLILGEGELRPDLEAQAKELGIESDVSLPGFVENPYAYMARSSVFVLSSRWEGLPGVLIEALYCGAPVVATDCPSGPREILADGRYGQLVPVGDAAAIARAILTTLEHKRLPPPPESWRPFETEAVVNQYIDILFGT